MVLMIEATAPLMSIALHASTLQTSYGSSTGVFDMIARWVAHAAVWRVMDSLGLPLAIAFGAAAVVFMVYRNRKRKQG
jgi:hypothetical protein